MPHFSVEALSSQLRSLGIADDARLCLAFSGGLDSMVLLHSLARIRRERGRAGLRAIHIDHQLHSSSARWRTHCESVASELQVPFTAAVVHVDRALGGVEAAARKARYDALRERIQPGEVLLTAHHADDQLETLLLALVRGAGVRGLSGVVADQAFGPGRLIRPLLAFTRAELEAWARSERLTWIEDPSNENVDLDRSFLRSRVAPALRERWPAVAHSAARSAAHLAEAEALLRAVAEEDLSALRAGERMDAARLARLDRARRRNALRFWLRERGARAPSTRKLAAIEHDLLTAGEDRTPCVAWDDVELRRYRGLLYLERRRTPSVLRELTWRTAGEIELPSDLGRLRLLPDPTGPVAATKLAPTLAVRFRSGGEKLRAAGHAHHRTLKKMLQDAGVPPWRRDRLPLVYSENRLVAVGDLWVADEFAAHTDDDHRARIVWERKEADSG